MCFLYLLFLFGGQFCYQKIAYKKSRNKFFLPDALFFATKRYNFFKKATIVLSLCSNTTMLYFLVITAMLLVTFNPQWLSKKQCFLDR